MRRARNENGFFNWPQQQQRRRRRQQQHQQHQQQKRKRVAVCVCCGTRKWFRFFGCGKVWGKKLPKIPAEPTTSSSGRADAEVDADGPAFMRNAIQNDCFQANTHTRGSSGRRCHGDALPRPSVATRPERRTRTAAAPKKTKEQRAAHKPATQSTNRESKRELEKKRQKSKKRNEKRHTNESTSFSTKDTETKSTNCTGCERRTKEKRGTFFWDWIGPCYLMGTDADCFVNELVSIWYFCVLKFWKSCRVGLRIVFSFSFYHWRIFCFLKL